MKLWVRTHPVPSEKDTVYVPAGMFVRSSVIAVNPLGPVQLKVKGAKPPECERLMAPLVCPEHSGRVVVAVRTGLLTRTCRTTVREQMPSLMVTV